MVERGGGAPVAVPSSGGERRESWHRVPRRERRRTERGAVVRPRRELGTRAHDMWARGRDVARGNRGRDRVAARRGGSDRGAAGSLGEARSVRVCSDLYMVRDFAGL